MLASRYGDLPVLVTHLVQQNMSMLAMQAAAMAPCCHDSRSSRATGRPTQPDRSGRHAKAAATPAGLAPCAPPQYRVKLSAPAQCSSHIPTSRAEGSRQDAASSPDVKSSSLSSSAGQAECQPQQSPAVKHMLKSASARSLVMQSTMARQPLCRDV